MNFKKYYPIISRAGLIILLYTISHTAYSQFTLTNGNGYIQQPAGVMTEVIKKSGVLSATDLSGLQSSEHVTMFSYVDGFGRPIQNIVTAGSPNGKDLISFSVYDDFGRQTTQFLSFEATTTSGTYQDRDRSGVTGVQTNQASFYSTTGIKVANDSKPWVTVDMEQSPMQRLLKQGNIGDGYQVTQSHYKTVVYRTNTSSDDSYTGYSAGIRKWNPDGTSSGSYSANDLNVTEGTDENSVKTIVFTDKTGRLILKRQQADETIGGTTYAYFDTYYVYDLLGNISYVIPPKALVKLNSVGGSTWSATSSVPELIFSYVYDYKNRVIKKKVPGADEVYIVYDPLNRPLLVQDGNMRQNNKWHYSKYDSENRSIIEGIYTDATHTSLSSMQSYVDGLSCYGSSSTTYYEQRTTGSMPWYTNNCFPTSSVEERLYCYYDDYDFDNSGSADYSYTSQGLTGEGTATDKTLGLPTGVFKKILGTNNWLMSYTFFDKNYNPIQVETNNQIRYTFLGDLLTNVVDFAGRITITKESHGLIGHGSPAISIQKTFSYDKMDRVLELKQSINGAADDTVAQYSYNALGQLVDKALGVKLVGSGHGAHISILQSVDYRYNIRGQLTSINNSTLTDDHTTTNTNDETNDLWGMTLLYDESDASLSNSPNYSGLLSAVKWKSVSPAVTDQRAYLFTYDKLNRMADADYKSYNTGSSNWSNYAHGFRETVTYDWNGNILNMQRNAVISGSVTAIDNVSYDYGSNNDNNKLLNVSESSSNSYGFKNITSSSSGYSYDNNGNITADAKKGITLTYNEMNKVVRITQTSTGKYIEYGYDASGMRISIRKSNSSGSAVAENIENIGSCVYTDISGIAQVTYFSMPEGKVRNNSGTFTYEYFITDQQGNVRISFENNGSNVAVVRQENSYYPFGMLMPGNYMPSDPNKKLYNAGSEWQDEINIEYFSTFFREYDPVLGRFNSVDPMAEATVELSVYHYSGNNPVNFNDPMGDLARPKAGASVETVLNWIGDNWNSLSSGVFRFDNGELTSYDAIDSRTAASAFQKIWDFFNGGKPGGGGGSQNPGGLKVTGDATAISTFASQSAAAMGNWCLVLINNGQVSLIGLTHISMTSQEQAFYDVLKEAADVTKPLVTIQMVESSEYVIFGGYALQQIDVTDISKSGKLAPGILAHEIYEQTLKQRSGDVNNENFAFNHFSAILWAEDPVNGYKRSLLDLNRKTYLRTVETNILRFPNGRWNAMEIQSGSVFFNYTIGNQSFEFGFLIERGNVIMSF